MSLLSEYEQRTFWKYETISGVFHTHTGLTKKINPDGSYAQFSGSTVVFRADSNCCQIIQLMQKVLYYKLNGQMLASPLPPSTTHMTLHDLISPEMCESDTYKQEVAHSLKEAAVVVQNIKKEYAGKKIMMTADRIVNMVSKSLVLLLKPQTEQDYELLLELYHRFDDIQKLPYPLTPHITLAYFKPGVLNGDLLGDAVNFAQINPENAPVFEFHTESLSAQSFLDMKDYRDIPMKICFCCDGGLNRSVLAANIVNHIAKERNMPVICEARSAYPYTQDKPISEKVWTTLENNGIFPDKTYNTAKYLENHEFSHFTAFAAISEGALHRFTYIGVPEEKNISSFFFGVRDPEYGEISYENAFKELYEKAIKFIDTIEI